MSSRKQHNTSSAKGGSEDSQKSNVIPLPESVKSSSFREPSISDDDREVSRSRSPRKSRDLRSLSLRSSASQLPLLDPSPCDFGTPQPEAELKPAEDSGLQLYLASTQMPEEVPPASEDPATQEDPRFARAASKGGKTASFKEPTEAARPAAPARQGATTSALAVLGDMPGIPSLLRKSSGEKAAVRVEAPTEAERYTDSSLPDTAPPAAAGSGSEGGSTSPQKPKAKPKSLGKKEKDFVSFIHERKGATTDSDGTDKKKKQGKAPGEKKPRKPRSRNVVSPPKRPALPKAPVPHAYDSDNPEDPALAPTATEARSPVAAKKGQRRTKPAPTAKNRGQPKKKHPNPAAPPAPEADSNERFASLAAEDEQETQPQPDEAAEAESSEDEQEDISVASLSLNSTLDPAELQPTLDPHALSERYHDRRVSQRLTTPKTAGRSMCAQFREIIDTSIRQAKVGKSKGISKKKAPLVKEPEDRGKEDVNPAKEHDSKEAPRTSKPRKLFHNMAFLLTGLKGAEKTVTREDRKGIEDMHEHVSQLLIKEGGVLHENFVSIRAAKSFAGSKSKNFVSETDNSEDAFVPCAILIADLPRRTSKYLQAVAAHIPCVHFDWVLDCLEEHSVLPLGSYLLKYGTLLKDGKDVWFEDARKLDAVNALADLRIALDGAKTFQEIWIPILRLAGAKIVDTLFAEKEEKPSAVLLEDEPSDAMRDAAKRKSVPLVTSEWVIQSLLAQKPLDFGEDEKFTYETQ